MTEEELFYNTLKNHRQSQNIEISEICEFTKINSKYIEAIENGDFTLLPKVYMRLFIRAYSNFIGTDSEKALEDYEFYTSGKSTEKQPVKNNLNPDTANLPIFNSSQPYNSQISPKQIATGSLVIAGLFIILYWAGQITNQQKTNKELQINQSNSIKNTEIQKNEVPANDVVISKDLKKKTP